MSARQPHLFLGDEHLILWSRLARPGGRSGEKLSSMMIIVILINLVVRVGTVKEQVNCLVSTFWFFQEAVVKWRLEFFLLLNFTFIASCGKTHFTLFLITEVVILPPGTSQEDLRLWLESPDSSSCCLFASSARSRRLCTWFQQGVGG